MMKLRLSLVVAISLLVTAAAWYFFRDAGIVTSMAIAGVYAGLLSANLPLDRWINLQLLDDVLSRHGKEEINGRADCPECGKRHRHIHFSEVLQHAPAERSARAHGARSLSTKLLSDIRHDWERGVFLAIVLLAVWGILAFGRIDPTNGGTTSASEVRAATAVGFDYWKAGITAVLGFFRLAAQGDIIHWWRKKNREA